MMIPRLQVGQSLLQIVTVRVWDRIAAAVERIDQLDKIVSVLRASSQSGSSLAVPVSNDTGEDLDPYSIVRLDGLKFSSSSEAIKTELPATRQPFSGKSIDSTDQWHKLAIFQTPVADGQVAPAIVAGVSYCLVEVTNEEHIRAYPDGTSCKTGAGPLRILHAPEGSGASRAAIVVFDYANLHYQAKAEAEIDGGATGTVKVWDGSLTDIELEVKNESSEAIPADTLLGIEQEASKGKLYINWQLCDEA